MLARARPLEATAKLKFAQLAIARSSSDCQLGPAARSRSSRSPNADVHERCGRALRCERRFFADMFDFAAALKVRCMFKLLLNTTDFLSRASQTSGPDCARTSHCSCQLCSRMWHDDDAIQARLPSLCKLTRPPRDMGHKVSLLPCRLLRKAGRLFDGLEGMGGRYDCSRDGCCGCEHSWGWEPDHVCTRRSRRPQIYRSREQCAPHYARAYDSCVPACCPASAASLGLWR